MKPIPNNWEEEGLSKSFRERNTYLKSGKLSKVSR
jgi:hypothetical protein